MPDNAKLIELAQYLLPNDRSLVEEIELAIEKPHDYVARFSKRLSYRGILQPEHNLPWIALVDGLLERGHLEEIDWRSPPDELQVTLRKITGQQEEWAWLWDGSADSELLRPAELFPRINEQLAHEGMTLMAIDIGSDSYPLIVLALDRIAQAIELAKLGGYGRIVPAIEA